MPKFTKGPWQIVKPSEKHPAYIMPVDVQLFGYSTQEIATLCLDEKPEQAANARLIVAAPELYEALEYCLDSLGDEFALPADVIKQAKAALSKAIEHKG